MLSVEYSTGELVWDYFLVIGIFVVNGGVLWVLAKSRELWKPRHLWMACLCIMDLFVGGHKCLELVIRVWPKREVCVFQRATLGIPFVVNMLLLTLLSLDRFVAVRYPFYYSSSVSNRHVFIGFILVLFVGSSMAAGSIYVGMQDPVCRAHKLQLVYLAVVLTICSVLALFFNSAVLKIAKRQLNAIYSQQPAVNPRKVSLFCNSCTRTKSTAFLSSNFERSLAETIVVASEITDHTTTTAGTSLLPKSPLALAISAPPSPKPKGSIVLSPMELHSQFARNNLLEDPKRVQETSPLALLNSTASESEEEMGPILRTLSLPILSEAVTLIVPSDPIIAATAVTLNKSTVDLLESTINEVQINSISPEVGAGGGTYPQTITVALPRSRSFSCAPQSEVTMPRSHPLFRFHISGSQIFQVNLAGRVRERRFIGGGGSVLGMGKLFPSIRFARTALLIMIPMWIFILPVITIIPLHRGCKDNGNSEFDCFVSDNLWDYLVIHVRSILPLQAITDALIYALRSKEFRHSFFKLLRGRRSRIDII